MILILSPGTLLTLGSLLKLFKNCRLVWVLHPLVVPSLSFPREYLSLVDLRWARKRNPSQLMHWLWRLTTQHSSDGEHEGKGADIKQRGGLGFGP
jgi:hypothetical protein